MVRSISKTERDLNLINQLADLWEKSVKTTHSFLTDDDIKNIRPEVICGIAEIETLLIQEDQNKQFIAFAGIEKQKLEMLFVAAEAQKQGIGRQIIQYAIDKYCVRYVDVNEQNTTAYEFYKKVGFELSERSEIDSAGRNFPILHLKL